MKAKWYNFFPGGPELKVLRLAGEAAFFVDADGGGIRRIEVEVVFVELFVVIDQVVDHAAAEAAAAEFVAGVNVVHPAVAGKHAHRGQRGQFRAHESAQKVIGRMQQMPLHHLDCPVTAKLDGDGFHHVDAQAFEAFDAQVSGNAELAVMVVHEEGSRLGLDLEIVVFEGGAELFQFVGLVGLIDTGHDALGFVKELDIPQRGLCSQMIGDHGVVADVRGLVALIPKDHSVVFGRHGGKALGKMQLCVQHTVHVKWQRHVSSLGVTVSVFFR